MAVRLSLLTCGWLDAELSELTPGRNVGTRLRIPIPAYLIQTEDQTILVDTGMPGICYEGNRRVMADDDEPDPPAFIPEGGADDTIVGQLARVGLRPEDVTLVVNTHTHFDHCGGNPHFTHCPILLQEADYAMVQARPGSSELPWWKASELRYQTIVGDHTLAPGVELLATPGHTPGHQSLLLRLPNSGPLLFTADAVYIQPLWQADELGAAEDAGQARTSMDRLRAVADESGAQVICGHDPTQWASLRHPPAYYE